MQVPMAFEVPEICVKENHFIFLKTFLARRSLEGITYIAASWLTTWRQTLETCPGGFVLVVQAGPSEN